MSQDQSLVYIPNGNVGWVEGFITNGHMITEDTVQVVVESDEIEEQEDHPLPGTIFKVSKSDVHLRNVLGVDGCEDMVNLSFLHEPGILYNIRKRFEKQLPYTYTGSIVISVNPYTWLGLYDKDTQALYFEREKCDLPPHVYATSAACYQHMRIFAQNQSILVSGESGAGKTETTKILMSHLASAGPPLSLQGTSGSPIDVVDKSIVQRVLQANPLMESFGNAKTNRNDNSSRFGKYSELQFNALGQLIGARASTYLLEKSRVSIQGLGERSYHIFYQLLAAPDDVRAHIHLQKAVADDFPYLKAGKSLQNEEDSASSSIMLSKSDQDAAHDESDDLKRFMRTRQCLTILGIAEADQFAIFKVVSAILYLSQLEFIASNNDEDVAMFRVGSRNDKALSVVCDLLQVTSEQLTKALTKRVMSLHAVTESYQVPLNVRQAAAARTALAIAIYSYLFQWLIKRVNDSTRTHNEADVMHKIGILDIFGFENFESNSFEQLCINYANEKLQQKFTDDIFKSVQLEYQEEEIPWEVVSFADNVSVLTLIEGRFGILSLLNEECMRPKGSDAAFANKLRAHYDDHDAFQSPRFAKDAFIIHHYAGSVQYGTRNFMIKNSSDALQQDLLLLLSKSKSVFLQSVFQSELDQLHSYNDGRNIPIHSRRRASIVADTVATQFKAQLNGLIEDIRRTNVHYIRCIKPNTRKSPSIFCKKHVTEQLRCAGVIEAIRISRCAYPNRLLQKDFINRFRSVAFMIQREKRSEQPVLESNIFQSKINPESPEILRDLTKEMLEKALFPGESTSYEIGKSRVYFRAGYLELLEERRTLLINAAAVVLQQYAKKWMAQAIFDRIRNASLRIQAFYRCHRSRKRYIKQRDAAIAMQSYTRRYFAQRLRLQLRANLCATRIQTLIRMHLCRCRYQTIIRKVVKLQSIVRMSLAMSSFVKVVKQAREDAKLENQIQLLKKRLADEREARMELEQNAYMGQRSSFQIRNAEALEGADSVIEQLQAENAGLREANCNLKAFNAKLRKEKEVMERGVYVNGASFAAANQRAMKLEEEIAMLKSAHGQIKNAHRVLKTQYEAAIESINLQQASLQQIRQERDALSPEYTDFAKLTRRYEQENNALAKANARLRLILRQDTELSRRHREEVPRLTKLSYASQLVETDDSSNHSYAAALKGPRISQISTLMNEVTDRDSVPFADETAAPELKRRISSTRDSLSLIDLRMERKSKRIVSLQEAAFSTAAIESDLVSNTTSGITSNVSESPESSRQTAQQSRVKTESKLRQPTGDDGPIREPIKKSSPEESYNEIEEFCNDDSVNFQVTLPIDVNPDDTMTEVFSSPEPKHAPHKFYRQNSYGKPKLQRSNSRGIENFNPRPLMRKNSRSRCHPSSMSSIEADAISRTFHNPSTYRSSITNVTNGGRARPRRNYQDRDSLEGRNSTNSQRHSGRSGLGGRNFEL